MRLQMTDFFGESPAESSIFIFNGTIINQKLVKHGDPSCACGFRWKADIVRCMREF